MTEVAKTEKQLPKLADLYNIQDVEKAFKQDQFNLLMNQEPNPKWIQINKFANGTKYIPIGVIETLLQKLFKSYKVEVLREGVMFNSVFVVVRLHLLHPVTGKWFFQDGIGANEVLTKAGASPAELDKIIKSAVQMSLPAAESYAIKDAAEKIGRLFGRDMNRKETMALSMDEGLEVKAISKETERKFKLIDNAKDLKALNEFRSFSKESPELAEHYRIKQDELTHFDQTVK